MTGRQGEKPEDRTIAISVCDAAAAEPAAAPEPTELVVLAGRRAAPVRLRSSFRIGRDDDCEVRVEGRSVSRRHAEVSWEDGRWWIADLGSRNGTFLGEARVERAPLPRRAEVRLGAGGPLVVILDGATEPTAGEPHTVSYYVRHYVQGARDAGGEHTRMIRQAVAVALATRRRRYLAALGVAVLLLGAAGAWSLHQHARLWRQGELAADVFYSMKAVELQLRRLEERLPADSPDVAGSRARLGDLEASYDRFVSELDIYDAKIPPQQRQILRVARVFGECEAAMPPGFVEQVERTIEAWRRERRLASAVERARAAGYPRLVAAEMGRHHLPAQFFYLALQESDFALDACGPETRYGIAKGPWQFIPATALAYGLRTGPLYLVRRADPRDERHDFGKATAAAARYIRDLYQREAQASGMLVIAAYNCGQGNVRHLIDRLPANPRERNFWRLIGPGGTRLPAQTRNYVLRVFSAAVIGEDPALFGFDFANPLADVRTGAGVP